MLVGIEAKPNAHGHALVDMEELLPLTFPRTLVSTSQNFSSTIGIQYAKGC